MTNFGISQVQGSSEGRVRLIFGFIMGTGLPGFVRQEVVERLG